MTSTSHAQRPQTPKLLKAIMGPMGEKLTIDDLPPPDTTRWVIQRKAEVVAAVKGGLLTTEEACARYGLTVEEYTSWQQLVERNGMRGLRVTRIQQYRSAGFRH